MNMLSTAGALIEQLRLEMGISQAELARRADVPRETVNRLEKKKVHLPELEVRRKLSRVLGINQIDLFVAAGEIDREEVDRLRGGPDPYAEHPLRAELLRRISLLDDAQLLEMRRYLNFVTEVPSQPDREEEQRDPALA